MSGDDSNPSLPPIIESHDDRSNSVRIQRWIVAFACTFLAVLFLVDPLQSRLFPKCLFLEMTGLLCPGCGGTRLLHAVAHGHFAEAFLYNPFLMLSLMLFALTILEWKIGKGVLFKALARPIPVIIYLGCSTLFGILRNLPCDSLSWLRP